MKAKALSVVVGMMVTLGMVVGCGEQKKNATIEHSSVSTRPPSVQHRTDEGDPRQGLTNESVVFTNTELGSEEWKKKVNDRMAALDAENARLEDEICEEIKKRGETLYPNDVTMRAMVVGEALRGRAKELYPTNAAMQEAYYSARYKKAMGQ